MSSCRPSQRFVAPVFGSISTPGLTDSLVIARVAFFLCFHADGIRCSGGNGSVGPGTGCIDRSRKLIKIDRTSRLNWWRHFHRRWTSLLLQQLLLLLLLLLWYCFFIFCRQLPLMLLLLLQPLVGRTTQSVRLRESPAGGASCLARVCLPTMRWAPEHTEHSGQCRVAGGIDRLASHSRHLRREEIKGLFRWSGRESK